MADKVRQILADNIKRYRASFGYSQQKLSELADISTSFIASIETCKKFPSSVNISKLADAFGIEPYELFKEPGTGKKSVFPIGELKEDLKTNINKQIETSFRKYLKSR